MDYFFIGFHLLVCLTTSYLKRLESKLNPSSNTCEAKIHQRKNTANLTRKEKQEKFIRTKWITNIERIWIFTKQELEKCKGENERPYNVPNEIVVQRICSNPSERLTKDDPLDTRDFLPFNAFTELPIENVKKACKCFCNMPENSCDVLVSDRGLFCFQIEQLKEKNLYLISFISWGYKIKQWKRRMSKKKVWLGVRHLLKSIWDPPNIQPLHW